MSRDETWKPEQTAIIVCDMWDLHHCYNAVQRENEFAPRLETLIARLRNEGVTIIHAPSGCMDYYKDHPSRKRATQVNRAENLPHEISKWCHQIPAEEQGEYPIDQSAGGEDDTPEEHASWEDHLRTRGKDVQRPWTRQIATLSIDENKDFITDSGEETWNIFESRGIKNVILTGVHTNMCVLGRPFGLRQLAKNGKNVVLMRDLTDTMYDPAAKPFVSHFTGTDLIVEHIEKFVCPTITSDQLIGGESFVFSKDKRPHVVFLVGEREYQTNESLPLFAVKHLGKDYRSTFIHASEEDKNRFPGIKIVRDADVLFISVRRRTLPPEQLKIVRDFVESGKPVLGIRTASHAFTLRKQDPPEGYDAWVAFDPEVFGGNYSNHYGRDLKPKVAISSQNADHPILDRVKLDGFVSNGSLYVVSPLKKTCNVLLTGNVESKPAEPIAWTFIRQDGGKSFYTSLGHVDDFANQDVARLLKNAIDWAVE